jgi:hypothetical protein
LVARAGWITSQRTAWESRLDRLGEYLAEPGIDDYEQPGMDDHEQGSS